MNIEYIHAKAEETGLPAASQDVTALTFVVHELPSAATQAIAQEMLRILKPGKLAHPSTHPPMYVRAPFRSDPNHGARNAADSESR